MTRLFIWPVEVTLIALLLLACVGSVLYLVTDRHRAWAEAQAACKSEARAEIQRAPWKANTIELADSCLYARRLRGDEP